MGVMAGAVFFVRGLAEFQAGLADVGIGYMVLTAVFRRGTAIAGWWMEGTDPGESNKPLPHSGSALETTTLTLSPPQP